MVGGEHPVLSLKDKCKGDTSPIAVLLPLAPTLQSGMLVDGGVGLRDRCPVHQAALEWRPPGDREGGFKQRG